MINAFIREYSKITRFSFVRPYLNTEEPNFGFPDDVKVNDLIIFEVFQAFSSELRVVASNFDVGVAEKRPAFLP